MEHEITEQWQPGQVKIDKICKGFPYMAATDLIAPLQLIKPYPTDIINSAPLSDFCHAKNICKRQCKLQQ